MSKWSAKHMTGAVVIDIPSNAAEGWLVETVRRQAKASGIGMPEVAIYDSPDVNAFATGMSRNNALVAVSTGLLQKMEQDEIEAVLAHEVSHIANGDMVTLTLIQGVVNTFFIFYPESSDMQSIASSSKRKRSMAQPTSLQVSLLRSCWGFLRVSLSCGSAGSVNSVQMRAVQNWSVGIK
jgi:Zn-dependent protease with chaperone function